MIPEPPERFFYYADFPDRRVPLHAMLVNCGTERITRRDYRWDGMQRGSRELVIWQYTIAGEGLLEYHGLCYPQTAGCAMLLIVPENHCYSLPAGSPFWDVEFVSVNGSEAVRLARECRRIHGGPCYSIPPDSGICKSVGKILSCCRRLDAAEASGMAYNMMTGILRETLRQSSSVENEDRRMAEKIRRYALDHLQEDLSVPVLAGIAGCSRWYFSRRFQAAAGVSPGEFVTELRMQAALKMLQSTSWSLKEIAAACGYEDPAYFGRIFRKVHHTSPGKFRRDQRGR